MVLFFVLCGFVIESVIPLGVTPVPRENIAIGVLVIACALAIVLLAVREMMQVRTTFRAGKPATALVTSGVFRRSRNPIYLSFVLFLLGLGIATANPWMILLAPLLGFYLYFRVIAREEIYLQQRFGDDYIAYKRKVRRWF